MSPTRRSLSLVALLAGMTPLVSLRALEWTRQQIVAKPGPGAEVVRARFEFKNTSRNIVHLLGLTTSCSCTEATPTTSELRPGETGGIDVLFTIGQRTGLQEKMITLLTDEAATPTRLILKVELPAAGAKPGPAQK